MQAGAECDMDDFDMSGLDDAALPPADYEFGNSWPGTGPIGNESPASTDIGDGMQTDDSEPGPGIDAFATATAVDDSEPGAGTDAVATATAVSARTDINDGSDWQRLVSFQESAVGSAISVSSDARERVAERIWQLDQRARVLFNHPAWQGLGGQKRAKWESLHKTHFRDKAFSKPGKGSGEKGRTMLCFKDAGVESLVAARATEILERIEEGSPDGLPLSDSRQLAAGQNEAPEPRRPPPVAGTDVSALLYMIARFPADRVERALAAEDDGATGCAEGTYAGTGPALSQHKRARPGELGPRRAVSGESIQGESGNARDGYMTFKKDGKEVGRVEDSDGGKGIKLVSASGDFAEWHPVARDEAPFQEGDLVGLRCQPGGTELHISRQTNDAEMLAVISRQAIVEGNEPPAAEQVRGLSNSNTRTHPAQREVVL